MTDYERITLLFLFFAQGFWMYRAQRAIKHLQEDLQDYGL